MSNKRPSLKDVLEIAKATIKTSFLLFLNFQIKLNRVSLLRNKYQFH
jgi:hypothetical protein